mgnify:CR=1 FL=1
MNRGVNLKLRAQHVEAATHDDRRPDHLPIPCDEEHEFLKEPMLRNDPVILAWLVWFSAAHVRSTLKQAEHGQWMLYTHRVRRINGSYRSTWCCSRDP